MSGGLTYGATKSIFATVTENGVGPDDPRVLPRTNEAIHAILDEIIPVGGMITADVQATGANGDEVFLPKEFENAIDVEVLGGATVNGSTDGTQADYNIVNQFAYVDPQMATDNPLVDLFLQPDPSNPTILRRKYQYPGLSPNATVRVTGAKRFIPITQDNDYLIVQNVLAVKDMIQAIERRENNDPQGAELYHKASIDRLMAEVKKHQLDPRNSMRRKAAYYADLQTFPENSFGWMRASLALEVPGLILAGKLDVGFWLNMAEKRLMQRGLWKDTIREYKADVTDGYVAFPKEVQSVLAVDLRGCPIPVRSIFHEYHENGPGKFGGCSGTLIDQGDQVFQDGKRRVYKLKGWVRRNNPSITTTTPQTEHITAVCKVRWVEKKGSDPMIITNFEALRLMVATILNEEKDKFQEAAATEAAALRVMEADLRDYLSGLLMTPRVQTVGFGMQCAGGML